MRRTVIQPGEHLDLAKTAQQARYVGSAEHKSFPSFAGAPKLRADASKCDPTFSDPAAITEWVRGAIEHGRIGAPYEGDFPRYVWSRIDGVCYEGRLVNRDAGEYKGYPIRDDECPSGI